MTAEVTPEGLYNHNAQGLVWAIEHCVRWGQGPPTGKGKPAGGWVSHCKVQAVSAYSCVLFDEKFHQSVAGLTVNLSGFIQICLSLSHVVVELTVRILLCSVRSTRSGPFATRLFVYLSHLGLCAVLKRLNGPSCPFV